MDEIDLYEYWDVIRRHRKLILLCTVIVVMCVGIALIFIPRIYRGRTTIIFPAQKSDFSSLAAQLGVGAIIQTERMGEGNLSVTYAQIAQSRKISEAVCKRLGLDLINVEPEDMQEQVEVITPKGGGLTISCYIPATWAKKGNLPWLDKKSALEPDRKPAAILAAEVANVLVQELHHFQQVHAFTAVRRNRLFVEKELSKAQKALSEAEEELRAFREANPAVQLPDMAGHQYDQLIELRTEQMKSEAAWKETISRIKSTGEESQKQTETLIASEALTNNPVVMDLKKQLADLEIKRAWLLQDRTEKHPDVVDIQERISATTARMKSEVEEITDSRTKQLNPIKQQLLADAVKLGIEEAALEARIEALNQVLEQAENNIANVTKPQLQLVRLVRETKSLEAVDNTLRDELAKAKIEEAKEPQDFIILDAAQPEKHHIRPRAKLTMCAGLILGLLFGTAVAFFKEGSVRARRRETCSDKSASD